LNLLEFLAPNRPSGERPAIAAIVNACNRASPKFDTVAKVLKALGVDLFAAYARQAAKAKPKRHEREHAT
jgi:hypothetical protein